MSCSVKEPEVKIRRVYEPCFLPLATEVGGICGRGACVVRGGACMVGGMCGGGGMHGRGGAYMAHMARQLLRDTVNERTVRILLECILVFVLF